jgi:hypothetical protein
LLAQTLVNTLLLLAMGMLAYVAFTATPPPPKPPPSPASPPGLDDLEGKGDLCVQAGAAGRVAYLMGVQMIVDQPKVPCNHIQPPPPPATVRKPRVLCLASVGKSHGPRPGR